ncbi:MAG: hypothetical protein LBK47_08705 [Prevotellaceae bacterium]|jgi:hypothetical protein|nr:hypothetical protein [Prevotellaceae bacterium]
MNKKFTLCLTLVALLGFASCNTDRSRLHKMSLSIEVQRFDNDLFAITSENFDEELPKVQEKYGDFFILFCERVIEVGTPKTDATFKADLLQFLTDTIVQKAYQKTQEVFPDEAQLNSKLTNAFKRYKLAFPNDSTPKAYAFVSGFNTSIILAENIVAIGLDRFLGSDFDLYTTMGFYKYIAHSMTPEHIPSAVMHSIAQGFCPDASVDLLGKIIWEGKLLYFTKKMLPDEPDSLVFGFTPMQLKLCLTNEAFMWRYLVENKLLFSNQSRVIREFTEEAPFTARFSQEAPGRSANFLGYRIVENYMRRHRNLSITDLLRNNNAPQILEQSQYNPK